MLQYYQTQSARLLQNPGAPASLYSIADLTSYINTARGQVAGEGECVRAIGTVQTVIGQRAYNFSSITGFDPSIQGVMNVRRIQYNVGMGQKWINGKSWEWFDYHRFNNPVPSSGVPTEWAQFGQGSAGTGAITNAGTSTLLSGSFYIDPLPDIAYTLNCDCVCYPTALVLDTDPEAIPYLFTDAVPYFAAYMALMSSQTSMRIQQAQQLKQLYTEFMARARNASNPTLNRRAFMQSRDPAQANKFGTSGGANATQ